MMSVKLPAFAIAGVLCTARLAMYVTKEFTAFHMKLD
jgi:hypothetical protein